MTKRFEVAFSLAGEQRQLIEPVAIELERRGHSVFYYGWPRYQAELAIPHLDQQLRRIYGEETTLLVPVLSVDYERKPWTHEVEYTVLREVIFDKRVNAVMALRVDDTPIAGFSKLHGFVDLRGRSSAEIADLIEYRLRSEIDSAAKKSEAPSREQAASDPTTQQRVIFPVTVPPLPRPFVNRAEDLRRLQQALTKPVEGRSVLAVAVYGMPGVGKTTLVQALCCTETRPAQYQDVVWITLGREPGDLRRLVREAAIALGGNRADYDRDEAVVNSFRELLRTSSVLLVLDDVWQKQHLEPFLVEGASSQVVFTTRDRTVAIAVGAREVRVETMTTGEAVQLLCLWTGRQDDDFQSVADRLGYHPLALRLAGVQLRDAGVTATEWLNGFTDLSQLKLGRATKNKDEDILICFDLTTNRFAPDDRLLYYSLGIFPYQASVPEETILRLWRQLGRQPAEARQLLSYFERWAVLDKNSDGISLHDLLRQYARERLGDSSRALHLRLLQSYGATDDQHVPDGADMYYLRFSAYHFREGKLGRRSGAKFDNYDFLGWMSATVRFSQWFGRKRALPRPTTASPAPFPETARVALMGSWGTGLYGAPVIAQSLLLSGPYDLLLHLGDIFYAGTETEVRKRFLRFWPTQSAVTSRALNGNHEMLSGGVGYFNHLLPALGQTTSYFAFANAHWMLIALDTAYLDADLDSEQRRWLQSTVAQSEGRKIVLFSHHYPFSAFEGIHAGTKLREAIESSLGTVGIAAWYWAHEMQCIVYDPAARHSAVHPRCVGNGGFPTKRRKEVRRLPSEIAIRDVAWKRFAASEYHPSGLVLDGPNPYMVGREDGYSPHGYATLEFDGPRLTERFHLADGVMILQLDLT